MTFPNLPPLSIPHHSKDLGRGITEGILDHLERYDLAAWEERLEAGGTQYANDDEDEEESV